MPAATLRQWERRYGCPKPERSESGYRLYADADLRVIETMKRYVDDGVPASRAADLVRASLAAGADREGRAGTALSADLVEALIDLDEPRADRVLGEAHALHPLETVLGEVIAPTLVEIGDRWHDGRITTANEHFASSYLQGRLLSLLSLAGGAHPDAPSALVACAPHDRHEIGALMLAVVLRRHGYRVSYLGADTPVADLVALAFERKPDAVLISATGVESLAALNARREDLLQAAPVVAFGGRAFDADPAAAERLGGHYLADNVVDAVERFGALIRSHAAARP